MDKGSMPSRWLTPEERVGEQQQQHDGWSLTTDEQAVTLPSLGSAVATALAIETPRITLKAGLTKRERLVIEACAQATLSALKSELESSRAIVGEQVDGLWHEAATRALHERVLALVDGHLLAALRKAAH